MVTITETNDKFIFEINGFHKFWALRSDIVVPKENIVKAYQDTNELHKYPGFRVGTYLPFVIIAGDFFLRKKKNFWDVMKERDTIIVELKDHSYHKLYIQVKNPEEALHLLNTK